MFRISWKQDVRPGKMIEILNYINGKFEASENKKILKNYKGEDYAVIFDIENSSLRNAKRNLFRIRQKLSDIPLNKIIVMLKKSMDYYYVDEKDFEIAANLTGSPISFIKDSFKELKNWCKNIHEYVYLCFNH